jgi:DNA modification methylase
MKIKGWQINLDSINISEDWNFSDTKEDLIHRIHAYPAKFPAFLTTKAISYAKESGLKINTIGDIFCGCGTTAYEAKKANINFWGCDINPVATLIAEVKSQVYNTDTLSKILNDILKEFDRMVQSKLIFDLSNINERIKYWHTDKSILFLTYIKNAINKVKPKMSKYKKFFLVAFSNILKASSRWLTKAIKPQIDPRKKEIDIRAAFLKQAESMIKAFKSISFRTSANINIENKNILSKNSTNSKLDLVVTSPPYVTSYEYADLHQLSSLWLDFAYDFRDLRKGTLGSIHNISDFDKDLVILNSTAKEIVNELKFKDKSRAKSAARYYADMQQVVNITYEKLNKKGFAVFVIGNTEYKGVNINNTQHILESMYSEGFRNLEVIKRKISNKILTPFRDNSGKFTNSSDGRKIYSEEFIVIGKKIKYEYH